MARAARGVRRIPSKYGREFAWGNGTPDQPDTYRVDAFLLDSYSAENLCGTGQVGDWDQAREFVLVVQDASGLGRWSEAGERERGHPESESRGVDVCSGVELKPGRKDIEKVRMFIKQCRNP